ncbi:MAG TPA: ABC transporter permease [Anaerolineaceae bacterium]|nr:ABC transporter permease [Anaerolineaceae bacterium]
MGITRRFFSHWQNWLGLFIVMAFIFTALLAPLLSPLDADTKDEAVLSFLKVPKPPAPGAPLGTLPDQTSVYAALIWGTRDALKFGIGVTTIIFLVGTLIGTLAAFLGGMSNSLLMWTTDMFLAFPVIAGVVFFNQLNNSMLFKIVSNSEFAGFPLDYLAKYGYLKDFLPLLSPFMKLNPAAVTFALFLWVPYARVMNASVMRLRHVEYVLAAKISGVKGFRVISRHLIPNAIAPVLVMAAKDVGALVVLQTTFAFIGLGKSTPWADALLSGRDWIYSPNGIVTYWWVFLPITVALILFGIGWNLLGDGLIEAMNPRSGEN